jgi:RecB family endonuclease NucS
MSLAKFVTIRHNYGLRESQIEDILIDNPYLLRDHYESLKRQVKFRDKTRADIIFYGTPVLVVELKRVTLQTGDVDQIVGYMTNLRAEGFSNVVGLLVGSDYDEELHEKIDSTGLTIATKRLGIDIPTELQKCSKCDRFCGTNHSKCPYCGHKGMRYWDSAEGKLV